MALVESTLDQACGESAACAITGDGDARGISAQGIAVFLYPTQRGIAFIMVCWKRLLGGFVVARGYHDGAQLGRHASILRVIHGRTTDEMAAAVRPHHHGARS